jgi:hypothetical protein
VLHRRPGDTTKLAEHRRGFLPDEALPELAAQRGGIPGVSGLPETDDAVGRRHANDRAVDARDDAGRHLTAPRAER